MRRNIAFPSFLLFFLFNITSVQSQFDYPLNFTSDVSDYYVWVSYDWTDELQSSVDGVDTIGLAESFCNGSSRGPTIGDTIRTNYSDSLRVPVGSNLQVTAYGFYKIGGDLACTGSYNIITHPVYEPVEVEASDTYYDQIVFSWEKGTDAPDDSHEYLLRFTAPGFYGESAQVGSQRAIAYINLPPGLVAELSIATIIGTDTSDFVIVEGSTLGLEASDGEYKTRTKLEWSNISHLAEDIRVERSVPGGSDFEELAILNKNATVYNDNSGIPGYGYTYRIVPIDDEGMSLQPLVDEGYMLPNGVVRGRVTSPEGAGVSGVQITLKHTGPVPGGGPVPDCSSTSYCTVTDDGGYYEFREIYYFKESEFSVVPYKMTNVEHEFTPDTLYRTLDEAVATQSEVNFVDETVITVGGQIYYDSPDACAFTRATVLIDDEDFNIAVEPDGRWLAAISDPGTYRFRMEYQDHTFESVLTGSTEDTLDIIDDKTDIDFINTTKRTVEVVAQGGCETPLGDDVTIVVSALGTCFTPREYVVHGTNTLIIEDLPARDGYSFDVVDVQNNSQEALILEQLEAIDIDLLDPDSFPSLQEVLVTDTIPERQDTLPDGTIITIPEEIVIVSSSIDTVFSDIPTLRFIYRAEIAITVNFQDAGAEVINCPGSDYHGVILMEQDISYPLQFEVFEMQANGIQCPVDQGVLVIYDEVSDNPSQGRRINILNGIAQYELVAGEPDVAESPVNNHQKWLYVVSDIDFADVSPVTYWVFVEGLKTNSPTFISGSPEIPQLILHDPPGDNSYAFVEQGTSITTFTKSSVLTGGAGGVFVDIAAGVGGSGFGITAKAGLSLEFQATAGRNNIDEDGYFTTINFLENFSTSSLENYTSGDGDVYIGSALNFTYAIAQALTLDETECEAVIDSVLEMGLEDFATTFVYTEKHIRETLLPNLATLMRITNQQTDAKQWNKYRADSLAWASILENNVDNRENTDEEFFDEGNISISAGATLSRTYSTSSGIDITSQYDIFFDSELQAGITAEISGPGGYLEAAAGVIGRVQYNQTEVEGSSGSSNRSIGYVISDNDLGDFITFDIYKDPDYDTPIFRTISGTTSCPNEPNTQPRDAPTISVFPSRVEGIPVGGSGKFRCDISNLSESGEAREYAVRVISSSNPDGALVRLAGSLINFSPASVFIDPGQTVQFVMTVESGPLASNYEGIKLMVYPPCEYALWQDGGVLLNADTFEISAVFESSCSTVDLVSPGSNWLVNQASNNTLEVVFGGYDANNPYLESLDLWIKKDGEGYFRVASIDTAVLTSPVNALNLNVSGLEDGNYTIRASAECGDGNGRTYSPEYSGVIDRNSLAPFGRPTPSDGFLRPGQDIKVTFDKVIDTNIPPSAVISLIRTDIETEIPFTPEIFSNELILQPDEILTDDPGLAGVTLRAEVAGLSDLAGNIQEYPVIWEFVVNAAPVFWDPSELELVSQQGQPFEFSTPLKNNSDLSKVFSLDIEEYPSVVSYPPWIIPIVKTGVILPNAAYQVSFELVEGLNPGVYSGEIIAVVDGQPITLAIDLEHLAKAVNWSFNPEDYQYSMSIVAQFSLDETDDLLSTDTRDRIAALVGGEIRGLANIEYLPGPDLYRAFITVYSDIQGGGGAEQVRFRFWRALTGVEYGAEETTEFLAEANVGTIPAPLILHPRGNFQVIPLKVGWNWISFNVSTSDMTRETIFQSVVKLNGANTITVKTLPSETCEYSPGSGWQGNLKTLQIGRGYLVHLSDEPDTLYVVGNQVPLPFSLAVNAGWNWIGYPSQVEAPVDSVIDALSPAAGDLLKGQDQFAQYLDAANGWEGSLKSFRPGRGYKLKLGTAGIIEYRTGDEYNFEPSRWEFNANITAYLDMNAIGETNPEDLIVGAFIDGECRGTASVDMINVVGANRIFLLVNGSVADLNKSVELRVLNTNTGSEYICNGEPVTFVVDGLLGRVMEPYHLMQTTVGTSQIEPEGYALYQNEPNPVSRYTTIRFDIPERTSVIIELFDLSGKLVDVLSDGEYVSGKHSLITDLSQMADGVYLYKITTPKFQGVRKLVKQ